jgi:membrane-bound lytic murein transglycosylase B
MSLAGGCRRSRGVRAAALLTAGLAIALAVAACSDPAGPTAAPAASTTTTSGATTSTATVAPATTGSVNVGSLQPPQPAGDPAGLAAQILAAETAVRDPAAPEAALAPAALAQQVAYRQLGRHPEWDAAVTDALPPDIARSAQRNAAARREFEAMHTNLGDTVPAWRIIAPDPLDQLVATYQEAASQFGLPWPFLAAIHFVETGTGRIRGTSTAGAQGPMQFLPATWAAYGNGGDIDDTRDAIFAAARYLAANGGAAHMETALWNYNHNDHYVRGVTLYAEAIAEGPLAVRAYHQWGVWYATTAGDVYLPIGYEQDRAVPVGDYRAEHPGG